MKTLFFLGLSATFLLVTYGVPTDKHRGPPPDLSDQPHYEPEHNPDYDHEAFLGKEEAEKFDQLSPEESRRRLG